ncbi:MAG: hypothetical protein MH204_08685, partial [Fimbriimonadaceae bacterium]|nr:hypothetical protein [Fimbriimonadaceae bacterium]
RLRAAERRAMIRPMGPGEVVDAAVILYRRIALRVFLAGLPPLTVVWAALLLLNGFILPRFFTSQAGSDVSRQYGEVVVMAVAVLLLVLPMLIVGLAWALGPAMVLASRSMRGDRLPAKVLNEEARRAGPALVASLFHIFLPGLFWVGAALAMIGLATLPEFLSLPRALDVLFSLAAVLAVILGFVGFFQMARILILDPAVAVIEHVPARQVRARAKSLAKREGRIPAAADSAFYGIVTLLVSYNFLRWGLVILFSVFELNSRVVEWTARLPFRQIFPALVEAFPSLAATTLVLPLAACLSVAIYYDRRVRKEGLDIDLLAEDSLYADRQTALLN